MSTPASSSVCLAASTSGPSPYSSENACVRVLDALRDHRVERLDGAVVDVVGDRLTVDHLRRGLADRQLLLVAVAGLELRVEHEVADLGAVAGDHVDAVGALEVVEVGRAEAPVGDVDVAVLDRELQRRGLVEVLDDHPVVLGRGVALVAVVLLHHGLLPGLVVGERVAAGADHLIARLQLVVRVDVGGDDRERARGQQQRPGRVGLLEVEDDGVVALGLDALHVREQRGGAVRVGDVDVALEREDDVLGGQVGAVGELQAGLQRALEDLVVLVGEVAALGRVRDRLVTAGLDGQEVLVHRVDAVVGGQVVGAGRVVGDRLVGRPADDRRTGVTAR